MIANQEENKQGEPTQEEKRKEREAFLKNQSKANNEQQYETEIIQNAIIKIGHLLALGFEEAGSMIIGSYIGAGGDVDPLLSGYKVQAIFGFCDIRNFTDYTEVL